MKKKIVIIIASVFGTLFILVACIIFYAYYCFGDMVTQIEAGQSYMHSLSQQDIEKWIMRSSSLLNKHAVTNEYDRIMLLNTNIPQDLRELKIIGIDIFFNNTVRYVWCGGFDHTALIVERMPDGQFEVNAQYNDTNYERLYPKD